MLDSHPRLFNTLLSFSFRFPLLFLYSYGIKGHRYLGTKGEGYITQKTAVQIILQFYYKILLSDKKKLKILNQHICKLNIIWIHFYPITVNNLTVFTFIYTSSHVLTKSLLYIHIYLTQAYRFRKWTPLSSFTLGKTYPFFIRVHIYIYKHNWL